ncbi:MAG: hemerythrin domain-containing protein [Archangiaceae bacterium]|nr:hemerythrin domain-containing protein [Archangiaceae bacterium]
MSGSLSEVLGAHHQACDEAWAAAEERASEGRWDEAGLLLSAFTGAMARHLSTEETVLFPAFEAATRIRGGPTLVMRFEHDQLRQLFGELEAALAAHDAARFAGAGETMMVLLQQHNAKEEHMLYPACEQVLGADTALSSRVKAGLEGGLE